MKISEIIHVIEDFAPLPLQESYDNAGLITGSPSEEATGGLFTLDVTEAVVDEAISLGYNLIIAHHPLIFKPLKRLTGKDEMERSVIKAIRNNIAVYAAHTNLDNVAGGVNSMICARLGLKKARILQPVSGGLRKVVVFVPVSHADTVRAAMFAAGAGTIGNYDSCSFNLAGKGTFRPLADSTPFVGTAGELHSESEIRIETVCPAYILNRVVNRMIEAHPYEEVAWDAYPLANDNPLTGSGMIAEFPEPLGEMEFLELVKKTFSASCVKYSPITGRKIRKVALCGGSGNFLIGNAMAAQADAFLTGELKYHDFFLADKKILLVEAGHYETEQFTKELLVQIVKEKFTTFATRISSIQTNPVNYL